MTRILVAEDDAALRLLHSIWLGGDGRDVRAVGDGREAIALVERGWVPHIAVLDVELPFVDGLAVSRYLHGRDRRIHLVVLSALAKPVSREDLLRAVTPHAAVA